MKAQAIVVLSGGISKKGSLPFFVKSRLDEACRQYHARGLNKIIVTGKWSYHLEEPPKKTEASAMTEYLLKHGIPKEHIIREEKSTDLISSLVLVRDKILIPKRITSLVLIGSEFQTERVRMVCSYIFNQKFDIQYSFTPSRLNPELLWNFYIYERKTMHKVMALFARNPHIEHDIDSGHYLNDPFYREQSAGFIRSLVYSQSVGKPGKPTHYSLASIYRIRKEVFAKYGLSSPTMKTLKTDFWFGRFLNFVCHDATHAYYCLKFALIPTDKNSYRHEIALLRYLHGQGLDFVPEMIASNMKKGPYWYLYKVVSGKPAGTFSQTYAFEERFYASFVLPQLIRDLKELRSLKPRHLELPTWNSVYLISKFLRKLSRVVDAETSIPKDLLTRSLSFVNASSKVLDIAPMYLSHNDLHTGNLLVSISKRKVYFIDFEYTGYNNIAFDMCFIYIFSWNNPSYQKKFMKEYIASLEPDQREQFEQVFPVTHVYFLIWFLSFVIKWRLRAGEENYRAAVSYIKKTLSSILTTAEQKKAAKVAALIK